VGAVKRIYRYDYKNDSLLMILNGLPNEPMLDIVYGSVLAGTTTGFYSIDLQPYDDIAPTDINQVTYLSQTISIYPNPAQGLTYVKITEQLHSNLFITLYNVVGEEVLKQDISKQNQHELLIPIFTNNLTSGIYLCKVELNNSSYFTKLIIQE
jgi:hypothetical protein